MSGDSTKECERYLFAGSSGSSILNEPLPLVNLPKTFRSPAKMPSPLASTEKTWLVVGFGVPVTPESPCRMSPPLPATNWPAVPDVRLQPDEPQDCVKAATPRFGDEPCTPIPLVLAEVPFTPPFSRVVAASFSMTPA